MEIPVCTRRFDIDVEQSARAEQHVRVSRLVDRPVRHERDVRVEFIASVAHEPLEVFAPAFLFAFDKQCHIGRYARGLTERANRTEVREPLSLVVPGTARVEARASPSGPSRRVGSNGGDSHSVAVAGWTS